MAQSAKVATLKRGDICTVYRATAFHYPTWFYTAFEAKIMGVIDGYAMLRRKGAMPFIESVKDLEKWKIKPPGIVTGEIRPW